VTNLRLLCISSIIVEDQHWIDVEFWVTSLPASRTPQRQTS